MRASNLTWVSLLSKPWNCWQKPLTRRGWDPLSIERDGPMVVRGDPARIRQILTNLVGNAIKFTERGEVLVRVASVEEKNSVLIGFEVKDTSIGISQDPTNISSMFFARLMAPLHEDMAVRGWDWPSLNSSAR